MTGKYSPVEYFLRSIPDQTVEVTLTFQKMEEILNDKLPPSAYRHTAWWANERDGQHIHAHSWLGAGWKVGKINLYQRWVRFYHAR